MKTLERLLWFAFFGTICPVLAFAIGFYVIWFGKQLVANHHALGVLLIFVGCVFRVAYKWIEICFEELKR